MDTGPILSAQWLVRFRWAVAAGAAAMLLVGWSAPGRLLVITVIAVFVLSIGGVLELRAVSGSGTHLLAAGYRQR